MTFTLFDLILRASGALGRVNESIATGGSTTTIVDSLQTATRSRFTDDVQDGTAFITHDAAGLSAAPEKEFSRISNFAPSTGTYSLESTLTAAVAAGDTYAWTSQAYPLQRMIGLANEALQRIGDIPLVDKTTLTADSSTLEYACAVAWKRRPSEVAIHQNDRWVPVSFDYVSAGAGSAGQIILPYYPPDGEEIRIKYLDRHPYVYLSSSVINEHIEPEEAVLSLVAKALGWNCKRTNGSNQFLVQAWNQAEQEYSNRVASHPTPSYHSPRKGKLMIVRDYAEDGD